MNNVKKNIISIIGYFVTSFYINANEIQRVTILADDSYPPYSYVENGELKGVYIDIIKASAKLISTQYRVKIVAVPWKRGLMEVKEGREFAILPPYKHIEERNYIWPYSLPIMTEHVVAYCQKDITLQAYISQPLKKLTPALNIGINAGYLILTDDFIQAKAMKNIVINENRSTSANIVKLFSKRIDCYLNDKFSTQWELSKMRKKRSIHFDNIQETLLVMSKTAHIGYTDNKSHEFHFKKDFIYRMDKALSEVISSDTYQDIINRYK
jgi:polar amino acid transport system substrate-binding protein